MTRFNDPVEYRRTSADSINVSRFAGMPMGVGWESDWRILRINAANAASKPTGSDGTTNANDWVKTLIGAPATPFTAISSQNLLGSNLWFATTSAADNDATQSQQTGSTLQPGLSWQVVSGTQVNGPLYLEVQVYVEDANFNQLTNGQAEWFLGLASTDTTILTGAANYFGFLHNDETDVPDGLIRFVAGRAAGAGGLLQDGIYRSTGWTSLGTTGFTQANLAADLANKRQPIAQPLKFAVLTEPATLGQRDRYTLWVNDVMVPGSPFLAGASGLGRFPVAYLCPTVALRNGQAVITCLGYSMLIAKQMKNKDGIAVLDLNS